MQDFDFFRDAGVVDARILQAIAQRLVIQQDVRSWRDERRRGYVPVVNPFVLLHRLAFFPRLLWWRSNSPLPFRRALIKGRDRGTWSSVRRAHCETLRQDLRQIQTSETRRPIAQDRRHNDTTTAFPGPANDPRQYISDEPFRANLLCRACGPNRLRRTRHVALPRFQNS